MGSQWLERAPWLICAPGVAIFITVLAYSFIGEDVQRTHDPRLLWQQS